MKESRSLGFGGLELIIIVAIFLAMYFIIFKGIDPARQVSNVNNLKRRMDVRALSDALMYYMLDHDGEYPPDMRSTPQNIAHDGGVDLCNLLVPKYISGLPTDPVAGYRQIKDCTAEYNTRYTIIKEAFDNKITISAPNAELGDSIEITQ